MGVPSASRGLSPEARIAIAGGARAEQARRSLYEFTRQAWHVLEPGVELEETWHVKAFCDFVQSMLEGWLVANGHGTPMMRRRVIASWHFHGLTFREGELLVQNAVSNLPPGTLKSRIQMVLAPAWMWLHCPTWSLCAISGVGLIVKRDSDDHRQLVVSNWYRRTFSIEWEIKKKSDSVGNWATTAGGSRQSKTVMESYQGVHVDALFLDDPDDAQKVHNEPARKAVQWKWMRSIKNRVKHPNRSIRLATQQRVHTDDWTAVQVEKGQWNPLDRKAWAWLSIPLLFGRGPAEAPQMTPWGWVDPRSAANENLHPARFTDEVVADEQRDRGPEGFEGQYNQNPASLEGGMIPRAYVRFFRIEDEPVTMRPRLPGCGLDVNGDPASAYVLKLKPDGSMDLDWMTMTIDCSNGSEATTASAVGILVMGGKGGQRFIFDDRTAIMSIETMYEVVKDTIETWPVKRLLIELAAAGTSLINDLKKALAGNTLRGPDGKAANVIIHPITGVRDTKEGRAAAMVSAWANGMVHVLDGAQWLYPKVTTGGRVLDQGFIGEMTSFPASQRDDRVDAMSQCMTYYRDSGDARARWRALSRL